jgi:DMSO/TMAO reductase YedYZ molybdopterin-dependent catalytic subunit
MLDRRGFLQLGALIAAWPRRALADSLLVHGSSPQNWATPTEYFDRLITPNRVFFVRSHFGPPSLRERTLTVGGLVDKPLTLKIAELRNLEEITVTAVLQCAGNGRGLHSPRVPGVQWEHGAMGQAAWTGVRLSDVLERAGVQSGAAWVRTTGADRPPKPTVPRFVRSLPIERALEPTTLLAYRMNGEPLSLAHGAPLRLVVPGWAGNHWTKWVTELNVQKEEADGFFQQTGYRYPTKPATPGVPVAPADTRPVTTFPVKSLIARPADGGTAKVGPQEIVGVAFSGDGALARVEVSTDGGKSWHDAALEGDQGVGRWQVFRHRVEAAAPGRMEAVARATDGGGRVQPADAQWNPSGYFWNGWHRVRWTVTA